MTIEVSTKYIAPAEPTLPALGVHITRLVDSYMIWVGVTETTAETVGEAPRSGQLCRDWACAMPSVGGTATTATTLYGRSDVAQSMARRLAKRIGKPVFLSVDIASALHGTRLMVDAEKGILELLLSSSSSLSTPLSILSGQ